MEPFHGGYGQEDIRDKMNNKFIFERSPDNYGLETGITILSFILMAISIVLLFLSFWIGLAGIIVGVLSVFICFVSVLIKEERNYPYP